jgi:cytidylate kinase
MGKGDTSMKKQCIVTIGREYGSGGREIGEKLAERLGIKLYDRNLLEEIAEEMNIEANNFTEYDEHPSKHVLSRRVHGYSNSMEDIVAEWQFDYMKKKAEEGESFVIVGRCAEWVLKGRKGVYTVFILGDEKEKCKRLVNEYGYNQKEAKGGMNQIDRKRKAYHNKFSNISWGDSRGYDLCVNSSRLGIDGTVDLVEYYVRKKMEEE